MSSASIDADPYLDRIGGGSLKPLVGWTTAAIALIWSGFSAFATVYDSDGSAASVQGLQNAALNGDTITLPSGTFTWTTRVTITKAITLQGAGAGQTIVRDGMQSGQLILWTLVEGFPSRVTGINFQDGGRTQFANAPVGVLHVDGSNTNGTTIRFDHNTCDLHGGLVFDTALGVIDHNTIDANKGTVYPYASHWNGTNLGDGSWAAPTAFGSSQFLFIEDNIFNN